VRVPSAYREAEDLRPLLRAQRRRVSAALSLPDSLDDDTVPDRRVVGRLAGSGIDDVTVIADGEALRESGVEPGEDVAVDFSLDGVDYRLLARIAEIAQESHLRRHWVKARMSRPEAVFVKQRRHTHRVGVGTREIAVTVQMPSMPELTGRALDLSTGGVLAQFDRQYASRLSRLEPGSVGDIAFWLPFSEPANRADSGPITLPVTAPRRSVVDLSGNHRVGFRFRPLPLAIEDRIARFLTECQRDSLQATRWRP